MGKGPPGSDDPSFRISLPTAVAGPKRPGDGPGYRIDSIVLDQIKEPQYL